jgi:small subunit ribosomal protein S15
LKDHIFMPVSTEHRTKIVTDYAVQPGDTGSPEVQVALLTERINDLSQHLQAHRKDYHSRRGLVLMAARRNRLLRYLSKADHDRYTALIGRLGLRK